jgi:1-acyl-sn-glycerol-3-phosphate acyltransferase
MPRAHHQRVRIAARHGLRKATVIFTFWTYTLMAPIGCVLFALLAFAWRRDALRRARRLQALTVRAYRFLHAWLTFADIARFDPNRGLAGLPEGPCVVVSNHPTLMDITAISATIGGGCTIVKQKLYRRRLLHGLLAGAGHIQGPSPDHVSIGPIVEQGVERLRQGFRVIVFPEGTRSRGGRLLPFGRTAFEIACRAGVPLVSLKVDCEPAYLSKEVPAFRPPHPTPELRLEVLAVDDPTTLGLDGKGLLRRVESRYRAWRETTAPAGTYSISELETTPCPIISKTG